VACTEDRQATIGQCRFCVHSTHFIVQGRMLPSPARAYCTLQRAVTQIDLNTVEAVVCDDAAGEGYRSIMNIIS